MKVRYNHKNIRRLNKQTQIALLSTAEALKTDLRQSQTIPKDQGHLEDDMFVDPKTPTAVKGVVKIIHPSVYSRKLYFDPEIHIKQKENPNAKQYWFEDYMTGAKKDLPIKWLSQFLKRGIGQ